MCIPTLSKGLTLTCTPAHLYSCSHSPAFGFTHTPVFSRAWGEWADVTVPTAAAEIAMVGGL